MINHLTVCEWILRNTGKPMTARDLVHAIGERNDWSISGDTPWKTINARISRDIVENSTDSVFMRVDRGLFALREWTNYREHVVSRRKINPVDESIAVIPVEEFVRFIAGLDTTKLLPIDYVKLVGMSVGMKRKDAEETEDFVQIVPTFFVSSTAAILSHLRTKKVPEKRLSNLRSLNFGGHLQSEDFPTLFADDISVVNGAMLRELREELSFKPDDKTVSFYGAIYDTSTQIGRQHCGLVFSVVIPNNCDVVSNEPGYLTSLKFLNMHEISQARDSFDSWSLMVFDHHMQH